MSHNSQTAIRLFCRVGTFYVILAAGGIIPKAIAVFGFLHHLPIGSCECFHRLLDVIAYGQGSGLQE